MKLENSDKFIYFAKRLNNIEQTTKRLEIQDILTEYLTKVNSKHPESLYAILYMSTATVYPSFRNLEMNIGEKIIQQIICECCGMDLRALKTEFVKTGDYGVIIEQNKTVKTLNQFMSKSEKVEELTILEVFKMMRSLCKVTGGKSTEIKRKQILCIIRKATPLECKFIVRLLECKLKIGLALQTVLISLSNLFNIEPETVKEAYNRRPDFECLIENLRKVHKNGLELKMTVEPGIPVKPMLASPLTNLNEVFDKFDRMLAEYKYDGERIQIHSGYKEIETKGDEVKKQKKDWFMPTNQSIAVESKIDKFVIYNSIFSRNNENITNKYNDVAKIKFNEKSYILDGEVVAYFDGKIQPFQVLSTRKRKLELHQEQSVSVCIFVFDLIYFDGEDLLDLSLNERREILHKNFKEIPGKFVFANGKMIEQGQNEILQEVFTEACDNLCEGLMIKDLSAKYKPSHRSNKWIKLKKDYMDTVGDSIDLVVIGAFYGKGKRTGVYGGFLLGCYNEDEDIYQSVCKLGTGFTEEDLTEITKRLKIIKNDKNYLLKHKIEQNKKMEPDIYVEPEEVWEVKAASLSESPLYKVAMSEFANKKGLSLRFPRFIKAREDKKPEMATTVTQLIRMYYQQDIKEECQSVSDEFN